MPVCVKTGQRFNRDGFRLVRSGWKLAVLRARRRFSLSLKWIFAHSNMHSWRLCTAATRRSAQSRFLSYKKKARGSHSHPPPPSPPIPACPKTPLISSPASRIKRQKRPWASTEFSAPGLLKQRAGQTVGSDVDCQGLTVWSRGGGRVVRRGLE